MDARKKPEKQQTIGTNYVRSGLLLNSANNEATQHQRERQTQMLGTWLQTKKLQKIFKADSQKDHEFL